MEELNFRLYVYGQVCVQTNNDGSLCSFIRSLLFSLHLKNQWLCVCVCVPVFFSSRQHLTVECADAVNNGETVPKLHSSSSSSRRSKQMCADRACMRCSMQLNQLRHGERV